MQLNSKQLTHPYICNGLGYLAWQLSRAMLFQWGLANRKSSVMPLSAATSSVWRTLLQTVCHYWGDYLNSLPIEGEISSCFVTLIFIVYLLWLLTYLRNTLSEFEFQSIPKIAHIYKYLINMKHIHGLSLLIVRCIKTRSVCIGFHESVLGWTSKNVGICRCWYQRY